MKKMEWKKKNNLGYWSFWKFLFMRYWLPILVFIAAIIAFMNLVSEHPEWLNKTDPLGMALTVLNILAVVILWFATVLNNWRESLPVFELVSLEKEGHVIMLALFVPVADKSNIREQAQTALKTWNDGKNLPLQQWLYESRDLGIWHDSTGVFNKGQPARLYLARLKVSDPNWKLAAKNPPEGKTRICLANSAALDVGKLVVNECTEIAESQARKWLEAPQPLPEPDETVQKQKESA